MVVQRVSNSAVVTTTFLISIAPDEQRLADKIERLWVIDNIQCRKIQPDVIPIVSKKGNVVMNSSSRYPSIARF